jgi:hypothetical protein
MPVSLVDVPIRAMSLRRSRERREGLSEHLGSLGLSFSFHDAVDALTMPEREVVALRPALLTPFGKPMSRAEIALAATLRALCGEIAEGEDEFVCVLEDDARLDPRMIRFLSSSALACLPRFDIFRFGHDAIRLRRGYVRIGRAGDVDIIAPVRNGNCTHAQVISRAGARAIADGIVPLSGAIDTHLFDLPRVRLRILETHPPLARQAGYPSNIQVPEVAADIRLYRKREIYEARRRAKRYFRQSWGTWTFIRARALGHAEKLRALLRRSRA